MFHNVRRGPRPARPPLAGIVAVVLAVAGTSACNAGMQQGTPDSDETTEDETAAPSPGEEEGQEMAEPSITVSPHEAPPGGEIRVEAVGLPPNRRIRIGVGPPNSEYEIIAETRSDADGRVTDTVSVPSWSEPDDRLVFVAETADHEVKVVSEPVRVTAPAPGADPPEEEKTAEVVEVTGLLTDEGVECQALRSDGGRLYTVLGDLQEFGVGDRVRVRGQRAEMSFCMQGTTLTIVEIKDAGGEPGGGG